MRPTEREQADFDRDGAVLMKGVVPTVWLSVLEEAIERDIAEPGPYFTGYRPEVGRFHGNQRVWEKDERLPRPSAARGRSGSWRRGFWALIASTSSMTSSS